MVRFISVFRRLIGIIILFIIQRFISHCCLLKTGMLCTEQASTHTSLKGWEGRDKPGHQQEGDLGDRCPRACWLGSAMVCWKPGFASQLQELGRALISLNPLLLCNMRDNTSCSPPFPGASRSQQAARSAAPVSISYDRAARGPGATRRSPGLAGRRALPDSCEPPPGPSSHPSPPRSPHSSSPWAVEPAMLLPASPPPRSHSFF